MGINRKLKFCNHYKRVKQKCGLTANDFEYAYRAVTQGKYDVLNLAAEYNEGHMGRLGIAGLIGTHSEMLASVKLREVYNRVRHITEKEDQIKSGDFWIKQHAWPNWLSVEVKTGRLTKCRNTRYVQLHHHLVARLKEKKSDRLCIVDIRSKMVMMMNYGTAVQYIKDQCQQSPWSSDYYIVPFDGLTNVGFFEMYQLELPPKGRRSEQN